MNKKKCIFSNKGFTLVEIIVAIAIAGIVSLIALKLFSFSNKAVVQTEDRSYNQMSVRNASIAITDRIRYAKKVKLLNASEIPSGKSDPAIYNDGYDYIYFDYVNQNLKIIYEDSANVKHEKTFLASKLSPDILKSYFTLEPPPLPPPAVPPSLAQVRFEITGKGDKYTDDSYDYTIKTTVNLVNSNIAGLGPEDTKTQPNPPGMAPDLANPSGPKIETVPAPNKKGTSIHHRGIRYEKLAK